MRRFTRPLSLLAALFVFGAPVLAQTFPNALPLQGRLVRQVGGNANGVFSITFRLYTQPTNGASLWTEVQTNTAVTNGLFNCELGRITAFPAGLFDGRTFYLGIQVASDPEMVPRIKLSAQAYAKLAENAKDVKGQDINPNTVTVNGRPVINATGAWVGLPTGLQGPTGPTGPTGPQGAIGATGPQGTQGPTGLQGTQGPTGPNGPQGPQGVVGPSGPRGLRGLVGLTGPQGIQGLVGPSGPRGLLGPRGATGFTGARGPTGPTGPIPAPPVVWSSANDTLSVISTGSTSSIAAITASAINGFARAIEAYGNSGEAVYARGYGNYAIQGDNRASGGTGVYGVSSATNGSGLQGWAIGPQGKYGVYGNSRATAIQGHGVYGEAQSSGLNAPNATIGVYGAATSLLPRGVFGTVSSGRTTKHHWCTGVYGHTSTTRGYGVFAFGGFGGTGSKFFVQPHPKDATKSIQFVCLEGNENGTYFRGEGELVNRRAEIAIPEEWQLVTAAKGITVQVTPIGALAIVAAISVSRDRIVIEGNENCKFAYFVNGVRRGFTKYEPYIPNSAFKPTIKGVPFAPALPDEARDILVANGILNPDYTPNEQTAARLGWTLKDQSTVPVAERWWLSDDERRRLTPVSVDAVGNPSSARGGGR